MKRARSAITRAASSTVKSLRCKPPQFADTVADNCGRFHAPGFPERSERHLHRKNGRLPNLRPLQTRGLLGATEFFKQREFCPRAQRGVASLHRLAKDRLVLHQIATHSPPLRALPAHDETDARRFLAARGECRPDFRALLIARKHAEFLDDLGHI